MTARLLSYRIHEAEEPAIVPPTTTTTSPPSTNSPQMTNSNSQPTAHRYDKINKTRSAPERQDKKNRN
ncbi:4533_t:CDS:1, partial [Gigaspora margarita]